MPQYNFNRRTEALRRSLLRGRQTGLAFEAPAVFSTKASDGTVIPIPLELLADEATIVVSQPDQCRPGERYAYVVEINNRKGKLVPEAIKKLGLKQLTQRTILTVIGLLGDAAVAAASKPVAALVGLLAADNLGNADAYHRSEQTQTANGRIVYIFLYGDKI